MSTQKLLTRIWSEFSVTDCLYIIIFTDALNKQIFFCNENVCTRIQLNASFLASGYEYWYFLSY